MYERMSRWSKLACLYLARKVLDRTASYQENMQRMKERTGPNTFTESEIDKIIQAIKDLPEDGCDDKTE